MLLYFWMITQIICESLPISSSGHVQLMQQIIEKYFQHGYIISDLFAFDYMLQGLSASIIFCYFFPYWWQLIVKKTIAINSLYQPELWIKTVPKVFVFGCIADGITFLFWIFLKNNFFSIPLVYGFCITGIALWSLQFTHEKKDIDVWACKYAGVVGLVQGLSLLPGISRFGSTLATLQWLGYQGRVAFTISFLLQWPLIIAGCLQGFFSLHNQSIVETIMRWQFCMLSIIAGLIAYRLLDFVGICIDKKILWKFSYYMIIPTIIALYI